ncbi:glucocorticoid-induced transcript 1 protein isoform X2 [Denticeps clupeoides]|uniref:glucocorticoid-induced transcript 1 protein isoform X2 n=1 Tax=Denticeps clupeoides TaxID=299321 RepID=UPI0010A4FE5D|nr:glucocorticoid-induced transcript 1 protein-like isoform X2 [Denticeps clupeoides]
MSTASDTNYHFPQPRLRLGNAGSPSLTSGPGGRLQPIRATVPYQLLRSPTRSPSFCAGSGGVGAAPFLGSSPPGATQEGSGDVHRLSPEYRRSPERCRERSKLSSSRGSTAIRRTSSLDTVTGPYLTGQWPRDVLTPDPSCMRDKATQTSSFWGDDVGDLGCVHQRSASWGSADHLREIAKLRQHLQRSKQVARPFRDREREQGTQACSQTQSKTLSPASTGLNLSTCRGSSYIEAINHELENVFINDEWEKEDVKLLEIQDGRRAPFPPHRNGCRRSTDTQAFSSCCSSPWSCTSPAWPVDSQNSSPCFVENQDKDSRGSSPLPKYATSPKPNNSFTFKREPPEGCERVKVFEETVSNGFPLFSCPDKNKVNFTPTGSAFCPVKLL